MLSLVIVRDERLATDDACNLLQPIRRNLQRRERARSDRIGTDHGPNPGDQVVLTHPPEDAERLPLVEISGTAHDLEGLLHQREIMLPAIDQSEFG